MGRPIIEVDQLLVEKQQPVDGAGMHSMTDDVRRCVNEARESELNGAIVTSLFAHASESKRGIR